MPPGCHGVAEHRPWAPLGNWGPTRTIRMKFSPTADPPSSAMAGQRLAAAEGVSRDSAGSHWEAQTPDPNAEWPCCVVHCGGLREQVVELSNQHLVDVLDFYFKGNQAHWNKTPTPSNS